LGLVEEIRAEQSHIDRAYNRLDQLREGSSDLAAELLDQGRGGLVSDRVERDARVEHGLRRRAALSIGDRALCFGRLDYEAGERLHVGRLGVLDEEGEPLVIDWRTPAAEPFYRATAGDRRGVERRRHIRMKGRTVVGLDDETLVSSAGAGSSSNLCGEGALMAALSSARTGRMGDIVATIQGEQDTAIRAPLRGVLVVQGGPGTGKTAVALHRAAYLLYAHHFPLAKQGVLVVGPNPVFCRYVEDVLPGLGETGVRVTTTAALAPGWTVRSTDRPGPAALKADLGMVDALSAAIASHQRVLDSDAHVGFGIHRLAVTVADSRAMVDAARQAGSHNAGRPRLEAALLRHLVTGARRAARRAARAGVVAADHAPPEASEILETLRRSPEVRALAARLWARVGPEQVVSEALEAAGLAPIDPDHLSEHDVALLDEAEALLGRAPARRRRRPAAVPAPDPTMDRTLSAMGMLPECPDCDFEVTLVAGGFLCEQCGRRYRPTELVSEEHFRTLTDVVARVSRTQAAPEEDRVQETFGHIIVDEAQDLTPMQWRMLARRGPTGSMTIVGDLGQAKHPWSSRGWQAAADIAAPGRPTTVLELTVNYRTPAEVMAAAAQVLAAHDPAARPPTSVRQSGDRPVLARLPDAHRQAFVAAVARAEADRVSPGKVAVVHPVGSVGAPQPAALDDDIVELDVTTAKGLEFDSVVVVEPERHSLPELYVAMTRTTRRLVLLTGGDQLPPPLEGWLEPRSSPIVGLT